MAADTSDLTRHAWLRSAASLLVFAALIFVPAGSLRYWQGWLFLAVFAAATASLSAYFLRYDPQLIRRRMTVGPGAETEPAQKLIISIVLAGFLLLIVIPGLDHRWQWSSVPAWLVIAGNAGVAFSFAIFFIVMKQNSYAASTITVEPGQSVVSTGLYGIVRHPMYSGALILLLAMPLALGSYWGLLVVPPAIGVLAWRLIDEERYLAANLPGYSDYCARVRTRLVPFLW